MIINELGIWILHNRLKVSPLPVLVGGFLYHGMIKRLVGFLVNTLVLKLVNY